MPMPSGCATRPHNNSRDGWMSDRKTEHASKFFFSMSLCSQYGGIGGQDGRNYLQITSQERTDTCLQVHTTQYGYGLTEYSEVSRASFISISTASFILLLHTIKYYRPIRVVPKPLDIRPTTYLAYIEISTPYSQLYQNLRRFNQTSAQPTSARSSQKKLNCQPRRCVPAFHFYDTLRTQVVL